MSRLIRGVARARYWTSVMVFLLGALWIVASRVGGQAPGEKCEYADRPGIGPCDPDQGYVWEDVCFDNDGCYVDLEECCDIIE
jgi:hypothetical protein